MHPLQFLYHRLYGYVEEVSTTKVAAIGGAGSGTSFMLGSIDPGFFDPTYMSAWFQAGAMAVGLLTGLSSLGLVWMKIVQNFRGEDKEDDGTSGPK